jgi:signal transduction histidine kinase
MGGATGPSYRGPDRRRSTQLRDGVDRRRLSLGVVGLALLAVVLTLGARADGLGVEPDVLVVIAASLATTLAFALAFLNLLTWRIAAGQQALYIGAAALCWAIFPLGMGVLVPGFISSPRLHEARAAFWIAGLPAFAVYAVAAFRPEVDTTRTGRSVVVPLLVVASGTALVGVLALDRIGLDGAVEPVPMPLSVDGLSVAVIVGWAVLAVLHAGAARHRSSQLLSWSALTAAGLCIAHAIALSGGELAQPSAWLMVAGATVAGLIGAAVELQRCYSAQGRRALDAVVGASLATTRAQAVNSSYEEQRHEARAAVLGIEAAARGLSRHRDLLTDDQFEALSDALVAEVHRLRTLIDERSDAVSTFDLAEAVLPVIACSTADGVEVHDELTPGIRVAGVPGRMAQVMRALLTNAGRYAGGSPVDVRAEVGTDEVAVYVEDRGPGIPEAMRERVFDRGVRGTESPGSGLGLFVARELMAKQHGSIELRPRPGGGSSFVLHIPRASEVSQSDPDATRTRETSGAC